MIMDIKIVITIHEKCEIIKTHIFDNLDEATIFYRNLISEVKSGRLIAEIKMYTTDLEAHF